MTVKAEEPVTARASDTWAGRLRDVWETEEVTEKSSFLQKKKKNTKKNI